MILFLCKKIMSYHSVWKSLRYKTEINVRLRSFQFYIYFILRNVYKLKEHFAIFLASNLSFKAFLKKSKIIQVVFLHLLYDESWLYNKKGPDFGRNGSDTLSLEALNYSTLLYTQKMYLWIPYARHHKPLLITSHT